MKYKDLNIQTQREFPNNARTQGFGWLVRAGYLTRENELTPLGEHAAAHLQKNNIDSLPLSTLKSKNEFYFPISAGNVEVIHCEGCGYAERHDLAVFKKTPLPKEPELPLEKVSTPDCSTIEALANFLNIPKEKTAKALMYTRISDGKFIFVVVRGDMQLSEAKLAAAVGQTRPASTEEIANSGAVAGYASPIGLKDGIIVVDDLIPESQNLTAGANETGFHLLNTNYPRDYTADTIADVAQAGPGDECSNCGNTLAQKDVIPLDGPKNILLALAESHHDEKGLIFPANASAFEVYLIHVPGKALDTRAKAGEIYNSLKSEGISVLFDDRDERAGVKFNDADLIGCPLRITVGEKALQNGMVELKPRQEKDSQLVPLEEIISHVKNLLE